MKDPRTRLNRKPRFERTRPRPAAAGQRRIAALLPRAMHWLGSRCEAQRAGCWRRDRGCSSLVPMQKIKLWLT